MRLFSYAEIKRAPLGTVFYACEDCGNQLSGPYVKDRMSDSDLYYHAVGPEWFGASFTQDHPYPHWRHGDEGTREGLFDHDRKYLVMDPEDILRMIALLQGQPVGETVILRDPREGPIGA